MDKPVQLLNRYVLDRSATEPLPVRAELYRALAEVVGDQAESKRLRSRASELESIDEKHRQLVLDFQRGAKS